MPYISKEARELVQRHGPDNCGQLNYLLTAIANEYVKRKGLRYQTLNDVVGAFDGAKAEFQRRVVAPYEDTKIKENGGVYSEAVLPRRPDDGDSAV